MGMLDRLVGPSSPRQNERQSQPDARQGYQQMQQDPAAFFHGLNKNVPAGMSDPMEIAQYLRDSGQIPPAMYNAAMQLYRRRPG